MRKFNQRTRKFIFKTFMLSAANRKYLRMPPLKSALKPIKSNFLLVTVAFNDAELVKLQFYSLKKLEDVHDYLVVDDSSDVAQMKKIETFCFENYISYLHLPEKNPGLDGSLCHGFALNWIFYNLVKKINPEYIGFLDPDLFVVSNGSFLLPWGDKDFWGVKAYSYRDKGREKRNMWRLWPGFCFFRKEFYQDKDFNFLPIRHLDTGGNNFKFLKNFNSDHLIQECDVAARDIPYDRKQKIQVFGNVVHLVGGTNSGKDSQMGLLKKKEMAYNLIFGEKN